MSLYINDVKIEWYGRGYDSLVCRIGEHELTVTCYDTNDWVWFVGMAEGFHTIEQGEATSQQEAKEAAIHAYTQLI